MELCGIYKKGMVSTMTIEEVEQMTGLTATAVGVYYRRCIEEKLPREDGQIDIPKEDIPMLQIIQQLRLGGMKFDEIRHMLKGNQPKEEIRKRVEQYEQEPEKYHYEVEFLSSMIHPGKEQSGEVMRRRLLRRKLKEERKIQMDYLYFGIFNVIVALAVFLYEGITIALYGLRWSLSFGNYYWLLLLVLQIMVNVYGEYLRIQRKQQLKREVFPRERTNLEASVELLGNFFTFVLGTVVVKELVYYIMDGGQKAGAMLAIATLIVVAIVCAILALVIFPFVQAWHLRYEFTLKA